ncbi:MAG: LamG domain-containing protein [Deltaproteobacteria bacterium]|nr:LamG domain-containing protein [Deltaproteobacteria bacterium]
MQGASVSEDKMLSTNMLHKFLMVLDEEKSRLLAYVDGHLVGVADTTLQTPLRDLDDVNNWLGRSNYASDPNFEGRMADFKIWRGALSGEEVLHRFLEGPL